MNAADMPPDWAIEEACKRAELGDVAWAKRWRVGTLGRIVLALARLIAKYEQPPVDPLEEALKAALKDFCPNDLGIYENVEGGGVRIFLDSLRRRGIEIRKGQP